MTPIADAVPGTPEFRYNSAHRRARNTVERTFGVLKNVFRCLLKDRVLHYTPMKSANIIYSCSILHNMRRERGMELIDGEDFVVEEEPEVEPMANNNNERVLVQGRRIRNSIIRNHFA